MGCASSSTGNGIIELTPKELKKTYQNKFRQSSNGHAFAAKVIGIEQPSLIRFLRYLTVTVDQRLVVKDKKKQTVHSESLLTLKSFVANPANMPTNLLIVEKESGQLIYLQTTELPDLLKALRKGLAYLTVGTPPQFLPFSFKAPIALLKPFKPLKNEGKNGGFTNQLRYLDYQRRLADILANPSQPKSINRGPVLCVADVGTIQRRSVLKVFDEVAALRALRFNLYFTSLNITDCVDSDEGLFWQALVEVFGYNVSLSEIHMPRLNMPSANWHALGQALLYNPRPFLTVWDLQGNNLHDAGLIALLPGMARIFCTISPPQFLDLGYNNLTSQVVIPFVQMLQGSYALKNPDPTVPQPPPPYLGKLTHLGLSGNDLRGSCSELAGPLRAMRGLQTLLLEQCMLTPEDFKAVVGALVESLCPLQKIGMGNDDVLAYPRLNGTLQKLFIAKERTMRIVQCSLGDLAMTDTMLSNLMEYKKPFPDITVELNIAAFQLEGVSRSLLLQKKHSLGCLVASGLRDVLPLVATVSQFKDLKKLALHECTMPQLQEDKVKLGEMLANLIRNLELPALMIPGSFVSRSREEEWQENQAYLGTNIFPILDALPETATLKELDISGHRFGDNGAIKLGEAMRRNRSIQRLFFDNNEITPEGLKGFRGCLYGNKKLIDVGLPVSDFDVYTTHICREIEDNNNKLISAQYEVKGTFRRHMGHAAQRAAIAKKTALKVAGKAKVREKEKAQSIMEQIEADCERNAKLYKEKMEAKQRERAQKQREVCVEKWSKKQLIIKQKLQKKVAKLKQKRRQKGAITKKYQYYGRGYSDPYRRMNDDQGDYYRDRNGRKHYYDEPPYWRDHGLRILPICSTHSHYYGRCHPPPPGHDYHYHEEQDIPPEDQGLVDVGQVVGEGLPEEWLPEGLPEVQTDNLDRMDELLQEPTFFNEENLSEFDRLANDMGKDVAGEFETNLGQAGNLSEQISTKAESWGSDITAELEDQNVTIEGLPPDEEPETNEDAVAEDDMNLEDVEAYGGAGPQDLPDGGPCGGASGSKIRSGCLGSILHKEHPVSVVGNPKPDDVLIQAHANGQRLAKIRAKATASILKVVSETSPLKALEYTMIPHHLVSKRFVDGAQVTLVTQCSVDRLKFAKAQVLAWGGMASIAVYINTENASRKEKEVRLVEAFFTEIEAHSSASLDIGLLFGVENQPWKDCSDIPLYPINTLRNLALVQAQDHPCPFVFLVDVDFIPSQKLRTTLESTSQVSQMLSQEKSKQAIIVPAFEPTADELRSEELPREKRDLSILWEKGGVTGFHTSYYSQGHSPTDFDKWFTMDSFYAVEYEPNFEPYVVVAKSYVPRYDERFRGYGMNKISHILSMHHFGFSFSVLPNEFVVAHPHPRSESWQMVYGTEKDILMKYRLQSLWNEFKEEVTRRENPIVSKATESIWSMAFHSRFTEEWELESMPSPKDSAKLSTVFNMIKQKQVAMESGISSIGLKASEVLFETMAL